MLVDIKAKFRCDECDWEFTVALDPADRQAGCAIMEVVEERLCSGAGYEDGVSEWGESGDAKDGVHLCAKCDREREPKEDDD